MKLHKIYFISDGKYIKIGTTSCPTLKSRLSGVQTGHPIKLTIIAVMLGGKSIEEQLHKKFNAYRANGEWFEYSKEIKTFVNSFCITDKEQIQHLDKLETGLIIKEAPEKIVPIEQIQQDFDRLLQDTLYSVIYYIGTTRQVLKSIAEARERGTFNGQNSHYLDETEKDFRRVISHWLGCTWQDAQALLWPYEHHDIYKTLKQMLMNKIQHLNWKEKELYIKKLSTADNITSVNL